MRGRPQSRPGNVATRQQLLCDGYRLARTKSGSYLLPRGGFSRNSIFHGVLARSQISKRQTVLSRCNLSLLACCCPSDTHIVAQFSTQLINGSQGGTRSACIELLEHQQEGPWSRGPNVGRRLDLSGRIKRWRGEGEKGAIYVSYIPAAYLS